MNVQPEQDKELSMLFASPHTFHIPVMGTGFTLETPLMVARFGISSVVSLVDDALLETIRESLCRKHQLAFEPIPPQAVDGRARRITAYLDLLADLVSGQMGRLREQAFSRYSEISQYFRMLPECSPLHELFLRMKKARGQLKLRLQEQLRHSLVPGAIDVNIMTKLDGPGQSPADPDHPANSDALAALRGFARSKLHASVVLSAGVNARLFSYLNAFPDFLPTPELSLRKGIILKVSDFRSAQTQGRMLARKGLWVSEFRIESGLNCGGHAFATQGHLLGPVIQEFREHQKALAGELFAHTRQALVERGLQIPEDTAPFPQRLTVQGGLSLHWEHDFLTRIWGLDATGWGTPFLLVPDATTVDAQTRRELCKATAEDIILSDASPLNVPFQNLRTSASEEARRTRIAAGTPGAPCIKGYLKSNTEFGPTPLCTASREYQIRKIREILANHPEGDERQALVHKVTAKACICHELGGSSLQEHAPSLPAVPTAICPGPVLQFFSKTMHLKDMVDHIYGRSHQTNRLSNPGTFIMELRLHIDELYRRIREKHSSDPLSDKELGALAQQLRKGLAFYRNMSAQLSHLEQQIRDTFQTELDALGHKLDLILNNPSPVWG